MVKNVYSNFRWMQGVEDKPGLNAHVLKSLKDSAIKDPYNYANCVLMFDEMSIKQSVMWIPSEQKHVGYVDLGGVLEEDQSKVAKNALVIMAVGLRKKWKAPVAFYFTAGLSGMKMK